MYKLHVVYEDGHSEDMEFLCLANALDYMWKVILHGSVPVTSVRCKVVPSEEG